MKTIKMGWEGSADAFSFSLIAMAHICMIIQDEYDPPLKFENFYQKHEVINKAIEMTIEKVQMVPNNERRTQIITLLHNSMEKFWGNIRKEEKENDGRQTS